MYPSILLLHIGCAGEALSEDWELDRMRILAARAEPADLVAGEPVLLESLAFDPAGQPVTAWALCPSRSEEACPTSAGIEFAQQVQLSDLTPEEESQVRQDLAEFGIIGIEPNLPPRLLVSADSVDAIPEDQRSAGFSFRLGLAAWSETDPTGDLEIASKRVPLRNPEAPNQNPVIEGVALDEQPASDLVTLDVEEEAALTVRVSESSAQTYDFRTREGDIESRTETVTPRVYTTFGAISRGFGQGGGGGPGGPGGGDGPPIDIDPGVTPTFELRADGPGEGALYVVVTDDRGGFDWVVLPLEAR